MKRERKSSLFYCLAIASAFAFGIGSAGCGVAAHMLTETVKNAVGDEPYVSYEEKIYLETVEAFLDDSKAGDGQALRELFSQRVQKDDVDLEEQIACWLEEYPGGEYSWNRDVLLHGSYSTESGKSKSVVTTVVPFTAGGEYYWGPTELTYENDFDPREVGITSAVLFSKEYYCALRYEEEGVQWPGERGMNVCLDYPSEGTIRVAEGDPIRYTFVDRKLEETEVKAFLEENNRYGDFTGLFGPPNAENIYHYYELPREGDSPRFLVVGVDDGAGTVYFASVVDDLKRLYTLWHE